MYYILDNSLNVVAHLDLNGTATPYYNDILIQKIADNSQKIWSDTFSIQIPYDSNEAEMLAIGNHILAPSKDDSKWYCYRIYEVAEDLVTEGIHTKKADCYNLAIWDFYHTQIVAKKFVTSLSSDIFQYILQGTSWELSNLSSYFDTPKSLEISEGSTQQAVDNVIQSLECEVEAFVEVENGRITRKKISFVDKLGDDDKKTRFEYSKNLLSASRKVSDIELYTKLFVYGGTNSKNERVTIASANGGAPFLINESANDEFNDGKKYLEGAVTRESILNPAGLLTWGKKQLEFYSKPHYEYTVDIEAFEEDIELGDTINVIDTEFVPELYLEARVIEIQLSQSDESQNKVVIGDFIEVAVETPSSIWQLQALASQAVEKANSAASWKVELFTPNGTDFSNVNETKQVIARVYEGMNNVTTSIERTDFTWFFIDANGNHNDILEDKYSGQGNVIEVNSTVAGYTVQCSVMEVTTENALFFALEKDHSFFSHLYNDEINWKPEDVNNKIVQYSAYEPKSDKIFWSQIYDGTQMTTAEKAKGETFMISRTGPDGMILDRMILKNGGHGSQFSVHNDGTNIWIFTNFIDIDTKIGYMCKVKYVPTELINNEMITIGHKNVTKLLKTSGRVSVDFKNGYYLLVTGKGPSAKFSIYWPDDLLNPKSFKRKHVFYGSDVGIHDEQTYQSSCIDFPYVYFTYGGTDGSSLNGDFPVLKCVDVRSDSVVYEIYYHFDESNGGIPLPNPSRQKRESEGISHYYDATGQKWLLKGFALGGENENLVRSENNVYRFKETVKNL